MAGEAPVDIGGAFGPPIAGIGGGGLIDTIIGGISDLFGGGGGSDDSVPVTAIPAPPNYDARLPQGLEKRMMMQYKYQGQARRTYVMANSEVVTFAEGIAEPLQQITQFEFKITLHTGTIPPHHPPDFKPYPVFQFTDYAIRVHPNDPNAWLLRNLQTRIFFKATKVMRVTHDDKRSDEGTELPAGLPPDSSHPRRGHNINYTGSIKFMLMDSGLYSFYVAHFYDDMKIAIRRYTGEVLSYDSTSFTATSATTNKTYRISLSPTMGQHFSVYDVDSNQRLYDTPSISLYGWDTTPVVNQAYSVDFRRFGPVVGPPVDPPPVNPPPVDPPPNVNPPPVTPPPPVNPPPVNPNPNPNPNPPNVNPNPPVTPPSGGDDKPKDKPKLSPITVIAGIGIIAWLVAS